MGRLWCPRIVTPLVTLPALCAAAPDDIGSNSSWLELRPRYDHIEESNRPEIAEGGTLRFLAGWRSAPWHGLRLTAEGIVAGHWGPKRFNDGGEPFATSAYPVLPDPRHAGVNRAHVDLVGPEDWRARLGRQLVALDNRRWVSENDFRQVPRLFDGLTVRCRGLANAELTAGHYRRIRSPSGEVEHARLTVAHAAWNPWPGHAVSAFGYFHDQPVTDNFTGFADNSYRVLGTRAEGVGAADWLLRYDHEVRGSNGGAYGLQIPLTDLYAFNGWTLHWFTVPRQGLRDQWVTGRWSRGPFTLYAEAHRFRSDFGALDFGALDFGDEVNASLAWEILPNAVLRLQYARYDPGSGRPADPEVRKNWLALTYTYP